ncbi:MAG: helix-turn-helix transcriptional regulator [Myxococcales bacterium]|nr:helix-turn-helix transcriptional regulator [Myxococcales bacterium]
MIVDRPLINPSAAALAELGGVMTGRRRPYHMPGYEGPLSIKSMVRGCGRWRTGDGVFLVEPGQLLILNEGQRYSFTIDAEAEIETFCPFFAPRLVREAIRARGPLIRLLDAPDDIDAAPPTFVERLRPESPRIGRGLAALRAALDGDEAGDRLLDLLDAVLAESLAERAEIAALPAVRKATRDELYRRVHRARDFIHASLDAPLSLAQLARVAAMSTYHFHRAFRAIVGETPGRYVTERRLLAARRLLATTGRSVTDVCLDVGFSSLGTFSSAYRRRFGVAPSRDNSQA